MRGADASRIIACQAGRSGCDRLLPGRFARCGRVRAQGSAQDLCRHRASRLHRLDRHRAYAEACGRCLSCQADRGQSPRRSRRMDRRAHPLYADRGVPLRQLDRRRLGGPRELLAARRGPDRLRRVVLRHRVRRERALHRQRHRQQVADHRRQETRHLQDHQGASRRQAARGRWHRGQRGDRLSRRRVPAVGPGSERHRPGQRQSPGHRLRHQEMHQRQLRAPCRISPRRDRSAGRRPRLDGGAMGARRRGAQEGHGWTATRRVSPRS